MEKEKMDRISEFTRIAKERPLTPEEETERAALRKEYRELMTGNLRATLESTVVVDPLGNRRPLGKQNKP